MENFFTAFSHEDSIAFLLSVFIAFLIGFIAAWIGWGGRAKRFRKEAEKWKKSYDELMADHAALREQLDLKEADLVRARREAEEAVAYARSFEKDRAKWQSDLDAALEENVKIHASIGSYQATIDDLNNQILGLKARNAQLSHESGQLVLAQGSATGDDTAQRLNELEARLGKLAAENESLQKEEEHAGKRLASLEARFDQIAAENQRLKDELDSLKDNSNGHELELASAPVIIKPSADKAVVTPVVASPAQDAFASVLGTKIPAATAAEKDDLTMIKGIGSFIEKKLNSVGIFTFEQISKLDNADIEKLTAAIEFFPGRIERDDWVGQAARLYDIKLHSPEAVQSAAVFAKSPTDLKIVEGIGPKIEKLLKDAGINSLAELGETSEARLREILAKAGERYRIHDPSSWPAQAALAAQGEWEKLKEYQDFLVGGRDFAEG
jgi:predicted flap endonuclease-1-like 5' DNA nuclease